MNIDQKNTAEDSSVKTASFVVPPPSTDMEKHIIDFFDSFQVMDYDIKQNTENAWNAKGLLDANFIDNAYKYCISRIEDHNPILLEKIIGLGTLAPQLIANDTRRVVSVLQINSRKWFMPFQFRNSLQVAIPQRMIHCIGLVPILSKTMEIHKYQTNTTQKKQHPYTPYLTHIHFFGVVNVDNII